MGTSRLLLVSALSLFSVQAWSIEPPFNNWCNDLGIAWCQGAFREPMPLLDALAASSPHSFLPAELADRVEQCEHARRSQDRATLQDCRQNPPLGRGLFQSFVLIPRARVGQAQLPGTGARVVADCTGRHIQLRADLSAPQQRQLIQRVFRELLNEQVARAVRGMRMGTRGGPGDYIVSVNTCDVGHARPAQRPRIDWSEWRAVGQQFRNDTWNVSTSSIPLAYVSSRCLEGASAPAPTPIGPRPPIRPVNQRQAMVTTNPGTINPRQISELKENIARECPNDRNSDRCRDAYAALHNAPGYAIAPAPSNNEESDKTDPTDMPDYVEPKNADGQNRYKSVVRGF